MKKDKMTEVITFRTSKSTKAILEYLAEEKDWSVSQYVERSMAQIAEREKKILTGEPDEEKLTIEDIEGKEVTRKDLE